MSNAAKKFVEREMKKKYYFIDVGILNLFLFEQESKLLENTVFNELNSRYPGSVNYYKQNTEVDFYLPDKKELIQVSYRISDESTKEREVNALQKAMRQLGINDAIIITLDDEQEIILDANRQIRVIPAWKWFTHSQ